MLSIIITSYKEPKSTAKAVECFLKQNIKEPYELIVTDPFPEVKEFITKKFKKYKQVKFFQDPGKGKVYALNLLFSKVKGDILILTDGDVFVSKNSVKAILKEFEDEKVGVVCGRPVSLNDKNTMFGYWSHLLADSANKLRKYLSKKNKFLECTGYLFAFRKGVIKDIPTDVAEDSIIPYLFWKKGYKIKYAEDAIVYVKNPDNFKDWMKQRKRTADAHTKLDKYYPDFPKVKCFKNEIKYGTFLALSYPRTLKEIFWTKVLFLARLYMWCALFYDLKFKRKAYGDGWERVKSTSPLDG